MQGVRRQDQERRVAPIDGRDRPRIRPGGRRDQPDAHDLLSPEDHATPSFAEELAAQEQEEESQASRHEREESGEGLGMPVDTLELHGRVVKEQAPAAGNAPEAAPFHVDVRV